MISASVLGNANIDDSSHNDWQNDAKVEFIQPNIIQPDSIKPINSVDFSNGDPFERLPWKAKEYYHFSKDQDLKELIRNFCSMQGIDVVLSDQISDVVNGKFSNISAKQFWKDITSAYGLVWFYDGGILYVYKSNEIISQVLQMSQAEMYTLAKVILQLNFVSSNFSFRPLEKAGILVVSGPPKIMSLIEELSRKVIVERVSDYFDIHSFPLKHAWAYDMEVNYRGGSMTIPGVASMLMEIIGSLPGAVGKNAALNISNDKLNEAIPLKDLHEPNNLEQQKGYKKDEDTLKSNSGDSSKSENSLNLGNIFITYDTRLNSVIVKAKPQDMKFIEKIVQQLDVDRCAIRIDVAVVDVSRSGAQKLGVALDVRLGQGPKNSVPKEEARGRKATYTQDWAATEGSPTALGISRILKHYSLDATLNILENVGDAKTLTRSSVITLDNIGAVIDRSSTQYVPVSGSKTQGLYDVTVSTKLRVVPHVVPGEFDENGAPKIKMLIEVTDGSFDQSPLQDAKSPATATNSVNTEASIYEGQNLFIGGYFHEMHTKSTKGVPFLKDLPLVGYLFKNDEGSTTVVERIYIISPTIIRQDVEQSKKLDRFFTNSQLSGKAIMDPQQFNLTENYKEPSFKNERKNKKSKKNVSGKNAAVEQNNHAEKLDTETPIDAESRSKSEESTNS